MLRSHLFITILLKLKLGAPIQKDVCSLPKLGDMPKLGDLTKVATCSKMARAKLGRVGEIVLRRFA